MKLKENKYTDKSGTQRTDYIVGKLNKYGCGVLVDNKTDFVLAFPPMIKEISYVDKVTGENKSFTSIKVLASPSVEYENVVLNPEYKTASFQLPSKYADWIKDCVAGDKVTVWLEDYTIKDASTGKDVQRTAWNCEVNGVNVSRKTAPIIPVNVPPELSTWISKFDNRKQDFIDAFDGDVEAFLEWVKTPGCETDYFVKLQEPELTNKVSDAYVAIKQRLGL